MYFVTQHDNDTFGSSLVDRYRNSRLEIGWPISSREGGVPHGTCDHHGFGGIEKQVETEGGLLDGVRPLGDDNARRAGSKAPLDLLGKRVQVIKLERSSRQLSEGPGVHGCHIGQTW